MEENKKDVTFRFYSVLKDEDAPPYLSDTLIVAADGLGGSGATVHRIDRDKFSPLREHIIKAAFSDMDLECGAIESEYLDELFESMTDERDDTSALWGSRIAIARFIYALNAEREKYSPENLAREEVRAELCSFVRRGLFATAEYFGLKVDRSGFSLLPTTLCAYRYVECEDLVRAEAMWAGDSRLYAFTGEGLKLISRDDEDASGAITNKFDAEKSKRVSLHREVYEIAKPCVLMAVSDGIFDPFSPDDNFGVENIFLETLMASDSADAMAQSLTEKFDAIRGDDATVSFKSFGFDGFEALKAAYKDRAELIGDLARRRSESNKVLEVMNGDPEEYRAYVRQRTVDKYEAISKAILDAALGGADDIVVRMPIICPDDKREKEEAELRAKAALEAAFPVGMAGLKAALLAADEDVIAAIRKDSRTDKAAHVIKTLEYIEAQKKRIEDAEEKYAQALDRHASLVKRLACECEAKHDKYRKCAESASLSGRALGTLPKLEGLKCDLVNSWWLVELVRLFIEDEKKYPQCKSSGDIKGIMKIVKACSFCKKNLEGAKKGLSTSVGNLKNASLELLGYIRSREALLECFDYEAIKHLGFEPAPDADAPLSPKGKLQRTLTERKSEVVEAIVDTLAENFDKTSLLDLYYNKPRLERFREYYRTKSIPMDEFIALDEQLKALYEQYLTVKPITE